MAVKKIRMRPEGLNDYSDILHPETSADVVLLKDTAGNFSSNNVEGALVELNSHLADYVPLAGGTMTGILTAQNNTSYTTKQVRNIFLSTSNPSGGSNGDIWIKYKA